MEPTGREAVERELRARVPDGVAALDAGELATLAAAVRDARHRQSAAFDAAGDAALSHVPRVLRGPVRKFVGR